MGGLSQARRRLAKIRCVLDTVKSLKNGKDLPTPLCFVPRKVEFKVSNEHLNQVISASTDARFSVRSQPSSNGEEIGKIPVTADLRIDASGLQFSNSEGDWIEILEDSLTKLLPTVKQGQKGWILVQGRDTKTWQFPMFEPCFEVDEMLSKAVQSKKLEEILFDGVNVPAKSSSKKKAKYRWVNVVEDCYMIAMRTSSLPSNVDMEKTELLSKTPTNWGLEKDEELAQFLVKSLTKPDFCVVGAHEYIEAIEVSTEHDLAPNLLDDDPSTFWESDGSQGRHYISLTIKPGVIIKQLLIGVDEVDDNYMPYRVDVLGKDDLGLSKELNNVTIDTTHTGDYCILENMTEYFKTIEIKIKECKESGIDCRIHGVKIVSSKQKQAGLNRDIFNGDMVRFPKLEATDKDFLYRRSLVLLRFMTLFDSVINYLLPLWEYTAGTFKEIEVVRQFLPLSRKVSGLIDHLLRDSESGRPPAAPKIFVNRLLAAEHLVNPSQDPDGKCSIFNQLYKALRPDGCEVKLDFRWSQKFDQWWECKFIGEGIIDQGGGFRDSLADMAEELCPSSSDITVPLPFFVKSPNQVQDSSNVYRDGYVPNPGCKQFIKYEWIGQIMGGCLRGKENLVLSLPSFIWKRLLGENTTWSRDYLTVDAAEVKLHEELQSIDRETFTKKYSGVLMFSAVLSGNIEKPLKPGGFNKLVNYEDLPEYLSLMQNIRMNESAQQINALRKGLLKTVPKAVLELLTWQELEQKICGNAVISNENLRKMMHCEDFREKDLPVKYLWQALENFTNEDRSRFLRFVTGRRRLPAPFFVVESPSAAPNSLPESATCSSTLFLPKYSSSKIAEDKIRYAIYNCVAIDTDMSPWED